LRSLRNHLDTDATARITHAQLVQFLLDGAKDKGGNVYAAPVAALVARCVRFEVSPQPGC
jgi:hypothetical protein